MAIAVDFIHDEAVVNALLSQIQTNLPATWTDKLNTELGMKRIEFGNLMTWNFSGEPGDEHIGDLIPSILVRFALNNERPDISAVGGKFGREVPLTVVHLFGEQQCYDLTAPHRPIQPERAKAQRAKVVSKAIWANSTAGNELRLGNPTLTTTDASAHIVTGVPGPVMYDVPEDAGAEGLYAFGVTATILTFTK